MTLEEAIGHADGWQAGSAYRTLVREIARLRAEADRLREDHQAATHEVHAASREIIRLRAELAEATAIVDKLPKIWRLVDGKLARDVPLAPGKCYYIDPTGYVQGLDYSSTRGFRTDSSIPDVVYCGSSQVYDSREAAEAARKGADQ